MTRNIRIASLTLASVIVLSAASAALAHGGGHVASSQHNPVYSSGGGKAVAAKSVNLGGRASCPQQRAQRREACRRLA